MNIQRTQTAIFTFQYFSPTEGGDPVSDVTAHSLNDWIFVFQYFSLKFVFCSLFGFHESTFQRIMSKKITVYQRPLLFIPIESRTGRYSFSNIF